MPCHDRHVVGTSYGGAARLAQLSATASRSRGTASGLPAAAPAQPGGRVLTMRQPLPLPVPRPPPRARRRPSPARSPFCASSRRRACARPSQGRSPPRPERACRACCGEEGEGGVRASVGEAGLRATGAARLLDGAARHTAHAAPQLTPPPRGWLRSRPALQQQALGAHPSRPAAVGSVCVCAVHAPRERSAQHAQQGGAAGTAQRSQRAFRRPAPYSRPPAARLALPPRCLHWACRTAACPILRAGVQRSARDRRPGPAPPPVSTSIIRFTASIDLRVPSPAVPHPRAC